MANTTWNASDKSANITLTGSNLIATDTTTGNGGVRAADKQISGKWYFEFTIGTISGIVTAVGVCTSDSGLTNAGSSNATVGAFALISGSTYVNGNIQVGFGAGSVTTGDVLCCALDLDRRLIYFRKGAAGNWNGVSTANPATAAGGIFIPLGQGVAAYPAILFNAPSTTNNQITANFGNSAFTGAVPSGFTSGFTAGAAPATSAVVTQAAIEEFGVGTPAAQLTQAAIEEWGTTNSPMQLTQIAAEHWAAGTPAMALTQVAIEQWAQVNTVNTAMALTQIALEQWASVGGTSRQPVICIIN